MRRAWPLTLRGTGAVVLALGCFAFANEFGLTELVWFGVLLLALVGLALASVYLVRRPAEVTRTFTPALPVAGTAASVTMGVAMRTALPTPPGGWEDTLARGLSGEARGAFPAVASGFGRDGRAARLSYWVTAARRGIHWVGPLRVSITDPFGLARRTLALGELSRVVVAPAIVSLMPVAGLARRLGGGVQTPTSTLGQGADDVVARPYAPGDSMRRIHWRASAHHDELMVRQEEQEAAPDAMVVLDRAVERWAPAAMDAPGADPGFEAAVSACASIAARLVTDGFTVDVVDSDGTPLCERLDPSDAGCVEQMTRELAIVVARLGDALGRVPDLLSGSRSGPLALVVGRLDPADAAAVGGAAHRSALPVLLAADPHDGALDAAGARGWRVAGLGPGVSVAAAWAEAVEGARSRARA